MVKDFLGKTIVVTGAGQESIITSTMENQFNRKNFVVTGAGSGIGRELVERLHSQGATVYALSLEPMDDLKSFPNVITVSMDLSKWTETRNTLNRIFENVELDGLVNNAGISIPKQFGEFTEDDFDNVMSINVKAHFNISQVLSPKLKNGSSIVNVGSMAGLRASPQYMTYSISKAALDAMTRGLALELGPRNIRVNSINPTVCRDTQMGRQFVQDVNRNAVLNRSPLKRFLTVGEVVDPILFLLSSNSSFISGHSLVIDGGILSC